jgi:hypothetical protein
MEWRNFIRVIEKAISACQSSKNTVREYFVEVNKMLEMLNSATLFHFRKIK